MSRSQRENVIRSPNWEIGVAVSNAGVRILIGSSELALFAHDQYKIGQDDTRTTGATWGGLQVAMHSQLPCFLVFLLLFFCYVYFVYDIDFN